MLYILKTIFKHFSKGQFDSVAAFDTHGGGNQANIDMKNYIDGLDNG